MRPILFSIVLALVLGCASSPTVAAPVTAGPRIGLVLGGGGARGAAHIGVLKELERQRVPIHAIAGTSMGAVIGGLYASGMTADEIEELIKSLDLIATLSDDPQRADLGFRRKQDDALYPINVEVGLHDGELTLPLGVIQGQKLDLLLRKLTIGVAQIRYFDQLPIPFRAIASDIEHGDACVLDHGDLAQALRASMSVPAMLAPVRIDDRLLVDGGLVGNLPIDVMRKMDVDVIIAVNVEFPLYNGDELDSVLAVTEQMLTILIARETRRQIATLGPQDILIQPDLGTFGSGEFGAVVEAIQPGIDAALAASDRLGSLSLDEAAYTDYMAQKTGPAGPDTTLAFVRIDHDSGIRTSALQQQLKTRVGDGVNTDLLARDANRLYGLDLFEKVGYQLVDENGDTGVEFQARAKSVGATTMRFAISLEEDFEGATSFNVGTRITKARLNSLGAEWRTDLQLGSDPLLVSEFYQPFGFGSHFFLAPHVGARESNINAWVDGADVARYRLGRLDAGIDVGLKLDTWGELRVGATTGKGRATVKVGDPGFENTRFDSGGSFARFRVDTLDHAQFPTRGINADLNWYRSVPGLGADTRFEALVSGLTGVFSAGRNTFQVGLDYASTLSGQTSIQDYFRLGGFRRLSGLERNQLSGPQAAVAKLVYYRQVSQSAVQIFDVPVYLGASLEAGNVWQSRSEIGVNSSFVSGSIFAGLDTYVGPVYVAAGMAEGGDSSFYLFVGSPSR